MYIITYVSNADTNLEEDEILDLLKTSKAKNLKKGITGIFIHSEGNFFQVLEGDELVIKSLFKNISQDNRHHNIIKLMERDCSNASYTDYEVSFTIISDKSNITSIYNFLKKEKKCNPEGYENIAYTVQKFMTLI